MINFVYISDVFRKAWKTYIFNPNVKDWPEFSESFKESFLSFIVSAIPIKSDRSGELNLE